MLCLYSSKGGVGCSVASAVLALQSADRSPTLLVDLRGDLEVILGADPSSDGLGEWFGLDQPSPDLLHRLEVPVRPGLSVLPRGSLRSPARPAKYRLLARLLAAEHRQVVVDVGTHAVPATAVLAEAASTVLVTRACFLALDAARRGPIPDQVILIGEEGRALGPRDVQAAVGAPVSVELKWHRDLARAVDAGLLSTRLPRSLPSLIDEMAPDPLAGGPAW